MPIFKCVGGMAKFAKLKLLREHGAVLDETKESLLCAAYCKSVEVWNACLELGADINHPQGPLHMMCSSGYVDENKIAWFH